MTIPASAQVSLLFLLPSLCFSGPKTTDTSKIRLAQSYSMPWHQHNISLHSWYQIICWYILNKLSCIQVLVVSVLHLQQHSTPFIMAVKWILPLAFVMLSLWEMVIFKAFCWPCCIDKCFLLLRSGGGFYLLSCFLLFQMTDHHNSCSPWLMRYIGFFWSRVVWGTYP